MKNNGEVRVGCSGWQYKHWKERFYPEGLPQREWLEYYAGRFDTVEVNNTFYRLPEAATFASWRERAPNHFLFTLKASRFLTHIKRLKEPSEPLRRFWDRAIELKEKLGPVLYQLPSRWPIQKERFLEFLDVLPKGPLQTVEFREPSWYDDEIFQALEAKGIALCLHDMPGSASPRRVVGPFVYLRLHGADAKYRGDYPRRTLRAWADWLGEQARSGKSVYVYFNNDAEARAVYDALQLREMLFARIENQLRRSA